MNFHKFVKALVTNKPIEKPLANPTPKEPEEVKPQEQNKEEDSEEELLTGSRPARMGLGYQEILQPTQAAQALLHIRRTSIKKVTPVTKTVKKTNIKPPVQTGKGSTSRKVMDPILALKEQRKRKMEQKALKKGNFL